MNIGRNWKYFCYLPVKLKKYAGLLIFSRKKSKISWDFQGQILRKIGQFHRKFWQETSLRNNQ